MLTLHRLVLLYRFRTNCDWRKQTKAAQVNGPSAAFLFGLARQHGEHSIELGLGAKTWLVVAHGVLPN